MLYWLCSKPGPATMALTAPVRGSIETSDPVKPGFSGRMVSMASCAACCIDGSSVALIVRPPVSRCFLRSAVVAPSTE